MVETMAMTRTAAMADRIPGRILREADGSREADSLKETPPVSGRHHLTGSPKWMREPAASAVLKAVRDGAII